MLKSSASQDSKKSILITGCSSGIGKYTAELLSKRGYHVMATARSEVDVDSLCSMGLDAFKLDTSDELQLSEAIEQTRSKCNDKLYALFNNAGFGQLGAVEDVSADVLREQFESNFFGMHTLTRAFIPGMRERREGRIIQNSSVLGFVSMPYRGSYCASKAALEALSSALRLETLGSGIHVSIIQPGPIDTNFRANAYDALVKHVDCDSSIHSSNYAKMSERLKKKGPAVPFTLPASSCGLKVIHALESNRPRNYYRVTFPTKLFFLITKMLPSSVIDLMLKKSF